MIHHLAPNGIAGLVLANGSMSSNTERRGRDPPGHRRGRPGRLHGRPARPALLHHADSRLPVVPGPQQDAAASGFRDRRGETLFIDARQHGPSGRPHPPRTERGRHRRGSRTPTTPGAGETRTPATTRTCPASARRATLDEIRGHDYVLTPGRYVGAADVEDDDEPFEEKMERLTATLRANSVIRGIIQQP